MVDLKRGRRLPTPGSRSMESAAAAHAAAAAETADHQIYGVLSAEGTGVETGGGGAEGLPRGGGGEGADGSILGVDESQHGSNHELQQQQLQQRQQQQYQQQQQHNHQQHQEPQQPDHVHTLHHDDNEPLYHGLEYHAVVHPGIDATGSISVSCASLGNGEGMPVLDTPHQRNLNHQHHHQPTMYDPAHHDLNNTNLHLDDSSAAAGLEEVMEVGISGQVPVAAIMPSQKSAAGADNALFEQNGNPLKSVVHVEVGEEMVTDPADMGLISGGGDGGEFDVLAGEDSDVRDDFAEGGGANAGVEVEGGAGEFNGVTVVVRRRGVKRKWPTTTCEKEHCFKSPGYGANGTPAVRCSGHKLDSDAYVKNQCLQFGCTKVCVCVWVCVFYVFEFVLFFVCLFW